jgi:vanillate O-demethylase ferredoxin subunit
LLVTVVAATGAMMVWRAQLDPIIYHYIKSPPLCEQPASIDAMLDAARLANKQSPALWVQVNPGEHGSSVVRFRDNAQIFLDPCTGAVLGQQGRYEGLFGRIEQLHKLAYATGEAWNALVPGTATNALITGTAAALAALLAAGAGIYLWSPRLKRSAVSAFTINRVLGGHAFIRNLHSTTGAYAALILIFSAVTGLTWAFDWPQDALNWITATSEPALVKPVEAHTYQPRRPLEESLQIAQRLMPDFRRATVFLPKRPSDPRRLEIVERDAPHSEAASILFLDPFSGNVLTVYPYASAGLGTKLFDWARALHTGRAGGPAVQIILFIGAIGTVALGITGIWTYFGRRRPKSRSLK